MASHPIRPTATVPVPANPVRVRTKHSVLAWAAWRRAALVVPVLACLWLAVAWASLDGMPL